MHDGQTIDPATLVSLAREAWQASGLSQAQAAERLGVSQPAFAQAVNDPRRSLADLRTRIVEAFTDYRIEGPHYTVRRKG